MSASLRSHVWKVVVMLAVAWCCLATPALAQVARVGVEFAYGPAAGSRYNDAAYDPVNHVYLFVFGPGGAYGRFVDVDGNPLGSPFLLATAYNPNAGIYNDCPRAAYSVAAGAFLVSWQDTRTRNPSSSVWGRMLKYSAGGVPVFLTGEVEISQNIVRPGTPSTIAYSRKSQTFLVTMANGDVRVRLVSSTGTLLGAETTVADSSAWRDFPVVAYNYVNDEFLIVWSQSDAAGNSIQGRRVSASTGALLDAANILFEAPSSAVTSTPDVQYDARRNQYLVTWWRASPVGAFGRFLSAGLTLGDRFSIGTIGWYDSVSLSRSPYDGQYLAAGWCNGSGWDTCGVRISPTGTAEPIVQLTAMPKSNGNFYARAAATTLRAEWTLVFSYQYLQPWAERLASVGGNPADGDGGVYQPTPCTSYSLSPTSASAAAGAGNASVSIVGSPAGCTSGSWSASGDGGWVGVTPGSGNGPGSVTVTWTANNFATPRASVATIAGNAFGVTQAAGQPTRKVDSDYDGDSQSDIALFRPSESAWYIRKSSTGQAVGLFWGTAGDVPVPGDYDGDGKLDVAVFRNGAWYIAKSSGGTIVMNWGTAGDIPVPADYDGDGKTDIAVYRPDSNAKWYIIRSGGGGGIAVTWGAPGDIPVPADFDGDGRADVAVFRPSDGRWYIVHSGGSGTMYLWGAPGDVPVPADYDGDGKADMAVFRAAENSWYICKSSTGLGVGYLWGTGGDVPVPADYDGDGKADIGVFRAGSWYIVKSSGGGMSLRWGTAGDLPV